MNRSIASLIGLCLVTTTTAAQSIVRLPDTRLNTGAASTHGVAQPKLARGPQGRLAATWLERTTQGSLSTEHGPILGVRTYAWNGTALTPVITPSFFGPNPTAKWFYSSFRHHDTAYRPDGILLAFLEHYGEQSVVATSRYTAEINVFALGADNQLIDLNGAAAGVMNEVYLADAFGAYRPQIAMVNSGEIFLATQEEHASSSLWRSSVYTLQTNLNPYSNNAFHPYPTSFHGQAQFMRPDVATNSTWTAMVWQDGRAGGSFQVYAQFFNGANLSGGNVHVNAPGTGAVFPSVDINASGVGVVTWLGSDAQIWARAYNSDGTARTAQAWQVSEIPAGGAVYAPPQVALMDNGRFMVVWGDSSGAGFRARFREMDVDGGYYGGSKEIADAGIQTGQPHVTHDGADYFLTWVDNRNGGADPYMKILSPSTGTSIVHDPVALPVSAALTGAYPNPFNPRSVISYQLSGDLVGSSVRLAVYDAIGREVAVLAEGMMAPGRHSATFDAKGLPSGVYVVVLEAGGTRDRRMVTLVK